MRVLFVGVESKLIEHVRGELRAEAFAAVAADDLAGARARIVDAPVDGVVVDGTASDPELPAFVAELRRRCPGLFDVVLTEHSAGDVARAASDPPETPPGASWVVEAIRTAMSQSSGAGSPRPGGADATGAFVIDGDAFDPLEEVRRIVADLDLPEPKRR